MFFQPIQVPAIAIIPRPAVVIPQAGAFTVTPTTSIVVDPKFGSLKSMAINTLSLATGFTFVALPSSEKITFKFDSSLKRLGPEGYRLTSSPSQVLVEASDSRGAFYGLQTLRQLLPLGSFGPRPLGGSWSIPATIIEDSPRLKWRGAHLDVGRHMMPKEWIKKYIDLLALHKINVFHWHLTEDQGWRIEIKRYPKLTQVGSIRKSTMVGHKRDEKYSNEPYGGYYTQQDAKEIVKYAAERHITVMPEIEMPGHSQAAIAAYPELGNTGQQLEVATTWGVIPHVFNAETSTIKFLQNVLDEIMAIFPSKYIHIGGDECPKGEWKASPRAQQLIKERGLKNEHELQSWFIKQMDAYLEKKGRRLVGWDEILEGGLAPGAVVMSWRGEAGGIAAAKQGHDVIMASSNAYYFDHYQADPKDEPLAWGGRLPLKKVYEFDPIPAVLTEKESKHVVGAQFQMWTEYVPNSSKAEYMIFPRACAAAEAYWTPKNRQNYKEFYDRLTVHTQRLKALGVNFRPLDPYVEPTGLGWKSGQIGNDYIIKDWDVTQAITSKGKYSVKFLYTSGGHRLDINGITILVDGKPVATDAHFGRTGLENVDNTFTVQVTGVRAGSKVTMRCNVRCDGGSDSNGEITITKI